MFIINLNRLIGNSLPMTLITMAEKYVEMWKNLGMDIEKHDQLLNGLGQYYTSAVLSQKNRPKKNGLL